MERLGVATEKYITACRVLEAKIQIIQCTHFQPTSELGALWISMLKVVLGRYCKLMIKHIDLVNRRIIKGEKIPHSEKLFSIFEQHTEWLNKGKLHKNVELGKNVAIATDQYNFILTHHVMEKEVDKQLTLQLSDQIIKTYGRLDYQYASISFDRNYFSQLAKTELNKDYKYVILPIPRKKSKEQIELESSKQFVELRKKHNAVESNINELECSGVNRCPDKGLHGMKRYIALGTSVRRNL